MLSRLSTSFPRISPTRSYRDRVYGMVDVYVLTHSTWRRVFRDSSAGAQAQYVPNNAATCNPNQYGIKLVGNDPQDAYAARWRQRQAYKARVAPPVRRMVRFELLGERVGTRRRRLEVVWGYQTCVAVVMDDCQRDCMGSGDLMEAMMSYYGDAEIAKAFALHKGAKHIPIPSDLPNMDDHKISLAGRHLGRMIEDLESGELGRVINGHERQEWCNALRHLDLRGSPRDNSITFDAITLMEEGELKRIPKGATMPKYKRIRGGGDLHYGNIGWWRFGNKWRTVCIDFGWHYVCNHVRGRGRGAARQAALGLWTSSADLSSTRDRPRHLTEQYNDCF